MRKGTAAVMNKPEQIEEIPDAEHEQLIERVAAVDVAKESGKVCVRLPDPARPGRRISRIWDVAATTNAVLALAERLIDLDVQKVTLESTSDYCLRSAVAGRSRHDNLVNVQVVGLRASGK